MVSIICRFLNHGVQKEIINCLENSFGGLTHAKIKILDSFYWEKDITNSRTHKAIRKNNRKK